MKQSIIPKIIGCSVPFIYSGLLIVYPIHKFDVDYITLTCLFFWAPVVLLLIFNFKWMKETDSLMPFLAVWIIMNVFSLYFENSSLYLHIWDFSEKYKKLLGINLLKAPIEEYSFWFGATPFCLLVYLYYYRLFKDGNFPWIDRAWELVPEKLSFILQIIPILPILFAAFKKIHNERKLSYLSLLFTTILFWITMFFAEQFALSREHWVYESNAVLGKYWNAIPIEEWGLYYFLGPIFVIILFNFFALGPKLVFTRKGPLLKKARLSNVYR